MSDDDKNKNQNHSDDDKNGGAGDDKHLDDKDKGKGTNDEELSEGQLKKAFEHPRFKELAKAKQELDELKANAQKDADDKLKKNQEFETLATKRETELNEARAELAKVKIDNAVERAAVRAGVVDPEVVAQLIKRDEIKVDKDGTITGIDEAVKALVEAKPYLVGKGNPASTNIGAGSNPAEKGEKTHPISWVRERWSDMKFVREKHDEYGGLTGEEYLNKVEAEGRIDYQS